MKSISKQTSPKALHLQAEDILRQMILKEEYVNGKLLPKEVLLAQDLGISRNTLRQAINTLVNEGLLIRKKGYGTKVAKKEVFGNARDWMSFSQEMQKMGIEVYDFEKSITRKYPNAEIANFFDVAIEDRLITLERVRGKVSAPIVYFISYFNPIVDFSADESFDEPLYDIIEKKKGFVLNISREEISAMLADDFLADKLDVKIGDPILMRKRYVFDINETPIEYNIGYYRADSFIYTIECSRY